VYQEEEGPGGQGGAYMVSAIVRSAPALVFKVRCRLSYSFVLPCALSLYTWAGLVRFSCTHGLGLCAFLAHKGWDCALFLHTRAGIVRFSCTHGLGLCLRQHHEPVPQCSPFNACSGRAQTHTQIHSQTCARTCARIQSAHALTQARARTDRHARLRAHAPRGSHAQSSTIFYVMACIRHARIHGRVGKRHAGTGKWRTVLMDFVSSCAGWPLCYCKLESSARLFSVFRCWFHAVFRC
jgi:hypothetical protein